MHESLTALLRAQLYTFQGRLAARPEVKFLNGGNCVTNARIAIDLPDKKGRDDTRPPDWIKLELWGSDGEAFADGCDKGDLIEVVGRVRIETWTDGSGEKRWGHVMRIARWQLLAQNSQGGAQRAPADRSERQAAPPAWDSSPSAEDDFEPPF